MLSGAKTSLCGQDHQLLHKKHAKHGIETNGANETDSLHTSTGSMLPGVYNAMELVVEEEPSMPTSPPVDPQNPNDTSNQNAADDDNDDDSDQELDQDALNEIVAGPSSRPPPSRERVRKLNDEAFQIFADHIAERPHVKDQVVRYNCSWSNADGAADDSAMGHDDHPSPWAGGPLWIRHDQQLTHIPPCEHCGAPRQFEFQLMPQLLHYLVNECSDEVARSTTTASGQNPSLAASQNEYTQTVAALQQADAFFRNRPHPKPSRRTWWNLKMRPCNACVGNCWKVQQRHPRVA
jgi:Programmed cell death protein 2, C-terminal putative domain